MATRAGENPKNFDEKSFDEKYLRTQDRTARRWTERQKNNRFNKQNKNFTGTTNYAIMQKRHIMQATCLATF